LECSLGLSRLDSDDGNVTVGVNLCPAPRCQLGTDRGFDAGVPEGILWLDGLPRVGFVPRKIGLMVEISLNPLGERRSQRQ
jgi:hypothetical protein